MEDRFRLQEKNFKTGNQRTLEHNQAAWQCLGECLGDPLCDVMLMMVLTLASSPVAPAVAPKTQQFSAGFEKRCLYVCGKLGNENALVLPARVAPLRR
jgi:hypothetical protein